MAPKYTVRKYFQLQISVDILLFTFVMTVISRFLLILWEIINMITNYVKLKNSYILYFVVISIQTTSSY